MSNRYDSGFREPPWVMGSPKEVQDWMDATYPTKDEDRRKKLEEKKYLKNLHIKFDLDVDKKQIEDTRLTAKILGKKLVEEDFEVFSIVELVLRGLAKAGFRNAAKIVVNRDIIYEHPEKKSDLRKTINKINDFEDEIKNGKTVQVVSILDDIHKCTATIIVKKVHYDNEHSVEIKMKGMIKKDVYRTFLNYLEENIGLIKPEGKQ